jgi:glycosyltransferase involved in cell wall biosynthesis
MTYSNKKIALVAPSLAGGGAEKIVVSLANYYSSIGYKVDLVLFNAKGPYLKQIMKGVNVVDLNIKAIQRIMGINHIIPLRRYLKKEKPATVLSALRKSNKVLGLASFGLNSIRIVFREANTMHEELINNSVVRFFHLTQMKIAYRFADRIIANSKDTANDLVKHKITDRKKIVVIQNPVLPDNYQALSNETIEDGFFSEFKTILSIGRLAPQKNFPFLLESFGKIYQNHPNTRLVIIGEGSEHTRLMNLASQLAIREAFKIIPFQQNIFPYIKQCAVFALSSSWEGFGNVLVEALALGKPIVSTNCPGGPKTILGDGKYGMLIPLNNLDAFSKALEHSLNNQANSDMLVARAKEFSVSFIAKMYLGVLLPHTMHIWQKNNSAK